MDFLRYTFVIATFGIFFATYPSFASQQKDDQIQFYHFDQMKFEKVSDKVFRRYVYGKNEMLVYWYFKKGAVIPLQKHASEQITYITKGSVKVSTGNKIFIVKAGDVIILPSNTPHEFVALEDTIDLDIFTPVRYEWFSKQ